MMTDWLILNNIFGKRMLIIPTPMTMDFLMVGKCFIISHLSMESFQKVTPEIPMVTAYPTWMNGWQRLILEMNPQISYCKQHSWSVRLFN